MTVVATLNQTTLPPGPGNTRTNANIPDTAKVAKMTVNKVGWPGTGEVCGWFKLSYSKDNGKTVSDDVLSQAIIISEAASGSSGTAATTNANDASSAAGTTTVTGSLARTSANDAGSASGTTTVVGTLARTSANDAAAASGTTTVIGTVAATNANDTASASGTAGATSGTVAAQNADDTASASGTVGTASTPAGRGSRVALELHGQIHYFEDEEEAQRWLAEQFPKLEQKVKKAAKRIARDWVRNALPVEAFKPMLVVEGPPEVQAITRERIAELEATFKQTLKAQIKRLEDEEEEAAALLLM